MTTSKTRVAAAGELKREENKFIWVLTTKASSQAQNTKFQKFDKSIALFFNIRFHCNFDFDKTKLDI